MLPVGEELSILVAAADALYYFAVPSLRLKMDGVPGLPDMYTRSPKTHNPYLLMHLFKE